MKRLLCAMLLGTAAMLAAESPYGVAAHINNHESAIAEQEFKLLTANGIRAVRTDFEWKTVEKTQGNWDFTQFDRNVELAKKYNIELLPILNYDVKWATPAWKHHPQWLDYVRRIVSRYEKQLPYWEVWNEQNHSGFWRGPADPKAYAELLKVTVEEIRKINPKLQILYGGTVGVPHDYIEKTLEYGAGKYFDVMNIHPYRHLPEPSLLHDIELLKETLKKHGASERIWITEFGHPTMPWVESMTTMIHVAFEKLGIDPNKAKVAYIDDPAYQFHANTVFDIRHTFPASNPIRLQEIAALDPAQTPVLIPCFGEEFPMIYYQALQDYIRRGGVVIFPRGVPLYYDWVKDAKGYYQQERASSEFLADLHIGWEAPWQGTGVPGDVRAWEAGAEFKGKIPAIRGLGNDVFLTDEKLKEGDRFYPLLEGGKDRKVAQAALYDFNSDLKGGAIVFTQKSRAVSETDQGKLLPRAMLSAFSAGVEKFFYYEFQSLEHDVTYFDQEYFFGILHRDLSPKPAFFAYCTLTKMRPEGSTQTVLLSKKTDTLWHVKWQRPDGTPVHALWAPFEPETVQLELKGDAKEIVNYLGEKLTAVPQKLTDGIIYLVGPEEVKIIR